MYRCSIKGESSGLGRLATTELGVGLRVKVELLGSRTALAVGCFVDEEELEASLPWDDMGSGRGIANLPCFGSGTW